MQDAKEEIRARLSIEDVVGQYVELKRAGRNLKALSPFTSEKTPSFMVSPEKGIWHDFSSNKGGDVFSFIMEVEGMTFREAIEHLANKAGVDLSQYGTGSSAALTEKKKRLLAANKIAERYYQITISKNQHAIDYIFYKRNFNRRTVEEFGIGYAPNAKSALVDFLIKKGFTGKELQDAGLTNRFGRDLFRGRITIPLMDSTGATIGFTGRQLESDPNSPKYLNTPQTLLYDKSRHVFGLSQAKDDIRKLDYAIIVEGNLDVIASHQAGFKNVVATAGTAMTESHLKAISRFSPNIRLAFDGDKAGVAATERAIGIAQSLGIELSIISDFGTAKDPDELIQQSPDLWREAIDKHQPAVDWLLTQYERKLNLATASGKREYSTIALGLISKLTDPVVKEHYFKFVSNKLNSSVDSLRSKAESLNITVPPRPKKTVKTTTEEPDVESVNQDNILSLGLYNKSLRDKFQTISSENFDGANRQAVLEIIKNPDNDVEKLDNLPESVDTYVKVLLLRAEGRYPNWSASELARELDQLLDNMLTEKLKKHREELNNQLKDAETLGDQDLVERLLVQISQLNKEINSAKR